jgi:hypothetical protein
MRTATQENQWITLLAVEAPVDKRGRLSPRVQGRENKGGFTSDNGYYVNNGRKVPV